MTPQASSYEAIRDILDTGDIVAFSSPGIIARLIRFATRSLYQHVAVVYRNDADRVTLIESSANYGGLRGVGFTYLSKRIADTNGIVDVFTLSRQRHMNFNHSAAQKFARSLIGRRYDASGAALSGLGQWLRIPGRERHNALFCSELADAVHCAGGLRFGKDRTPTPEEIIRRDIYGACWRVKGAA